MRHIPPAQLPTYYLMHGITYATICAAIVTIANPTIIHKLISAAIATSCILFWTWYAKDWGT